jgi:hypothetical protein
VTDLETISCIGNDGPQWFPVRPAINSFGPKLRAIPAATRLVTDTRDFREIVRWMGVWWDCPFPLEKWRIDKGPFNAAVEYVQSGRLVL